MELRERHPELASMDPAEVPDRIFGRLFGGYAAPAILADLEPFATEWRPDLVVSDAAEFAGHVVAALHGVPSVTKGFGPVLPELRVARAAEEVAPLWESRGLEPRPYGGAYDWLYLDIYPPAIQPEPPAHIPRRELLHPLGDDVQGEPSGPLPLPDGPPGAPLVYITMGTVFTNVDLVRSTVAALAAVGARLLVTVGPDGDPTLGGDAPSLPQSARVERYVPQSRVLPHCDVVVSHAGSGTVLSTLALGLPQLCLPQGADQFLNAAAVAGAGAGIALPPAEATPEAVREAVGRLLTEPSFAEAAAGVQASIASMPSADDAVCLLESLVAGT